MMLTTRWNNNNPTRLPTILPKLGDTSQQPPTRPRSNDSTQSIDNAYSLEHLFTALRRRIQRIMQIYNATNFYHALKICARVFQSYASYNLNTIDEFARRLGKTPRDNKKLLGVIEQFRLQLAELRHCHSTFQAELLVTSLAIDFHEHDLEQQQKGLSLPVATGKFSPRSRLSKFRLQHARQAVDLKSQLKQTNENLLILLFDEFNANLSHLWDESDKYLTGSLPFHDHHMSYVLRLIPDIALKFEYALQICTKLFDLETTMLETYPQNPPATNQNKLSHRATPVMSMNYTPRSEFNISQQDLPEQISYQKLPSTKNTEQLSTLYSADIASASSVSSAAKLTNTAASPAFQFRPNDPMGLMDQHEDNPIFPSLFASSEKIVDSTNDQNKLQLLMQQLDKRLADEESYRQRLLQCLQQSSNKSEQLNRLPKGKMLSLVMSDEPAVAEYQRSLCLSDYQIYKSVAEEFNVAIRETQYRIDWLNTVRARAQHCLGP